MLQSTLLSRHYLFTGVKCKLLPLWHLNFPQGLWIFMVAGFWLQVIRARCRRKNPNPCLSVCSKTQPNWEAGKQNVAGSCVAAAPRAMWRGRPPSPRRHKQAQLQFCWNVAKPSAKWNPSRAVLLARTRQFLLTGFVTNTSARQKQNKFSVIACTEIVFC